MGVLRWQPPQALASNASLQVDATSYPPSCPQYLSATKSVYNQDIPAWIPYRYDQPAAAGASLQTSSEDCLYLGIWTPTNATNTSSLPVLMFITGKYRFGAPTLTMDPNPLTYFQLANASGQSLIASRRRLFDERGAGASSDSQSLGTADAVTHCRDDQL